MTKQEIIDDVMDYLNFEKIHKVMVATNWEWANVNGVPEVYQLRQFLRKFLRDFLDSTNVEAACGGFYIKRYEDGSIKVSFEVNSWTVYND